jgi:GAF domain-containing protein
MDDRLLALALVEFADTLVDDFDLVEFLQKVTERTVELLEIDAVGILLAGPSGRLSLVAASTEKAQFLETIQLQKEQGPCLDVFATGALVICDDLTTEPRWPRFVPAALAAGFRSVHAVPMRFRDQVIGGINLFRTVPGSLPGETLHYAQALADMTTIGILSERALRQADVVAVELQYALENRVILEQAKGFLAERHGIELPAASGLLRTFAAEHGLKVTDVAHAVMNRDPLVAGLTMPRRTAR